MTAPRTFSDFIRNATDEEKRVIYENIMREVDASQAAIVQAALNPVAPDSLVARLRATQDRVSNILADALGGHNERYTFAGGYVRWGRVEQDILAAIDAIRHTTEG